MRKFYVLISIFFCLYEIHAQDNSWLAQSMYTQDAGMVFSPDGETVCIYDYINNDGTKASIRSTKTRTEKYSHTFPNRASYLRISNKNNFILTIDSSNNVSIREQRTGLLINTISIDTLPNCIVTDVKFRDNDSTFTLVRKYLDYYIFVDVWNVKQKVPLQSDTLRDYNEIENLHLSANGELLCYGLKDTLKVYSVSMKALTSTSTDYINTNGEVIGYSHENSLIAYSGDSGISIFNITNTSVKIVSHNLTLTGTHAEFNNTNTQIALSGGIYTIDLKNSPIFVPIEGEFRSANSQTSDLFHFTDDNTLWVTANRQTACRLSFYDRYNITTKGIVFLVYDVQNENLLNQFPLGHGKEKNITSVEFSGNDEILATTDQTNITCFWKVKDGSFVRDVFTPNSKPYLTSSGSEYVVADTRVLKAYRIDSPVLLWTISYEPLSSSPRILTTNNGLHIFVVTNTKFHCYNTKFRSLEYTISGIINNPSVTSYNTLLYTSDSLVKEFNPGTGLTQTLRVINNEKLPADSVNFAFDGTSLIVFNIKRYINKTREVKVYAMRAYNIHNGTMYYSDSLVSTHLVPYPTPNGKQIFCSINRIADSLRYFSSQALIIDALTKLPLCDTNYYGYVNHPVYFNAVPSKSHNVVVYTLTCGSSIIVSPPPCSTPTAIELEENQQAANHSKIYPQPLADFAKFTFEAPTTHKNLAQFVLYNYQAVPVFETDIVLNDGKEQTIELNVPKLPDGVYLSEIVVGTTVIRNKVLIIH